MNRTFKLAWYSLTLMTMLFSTVTFAAGTDRVTVKPITKGKLTAGKIPYSFQLVDKKNQKTIKDTDLKESHTKLMHMIVYDSTLNEFNHVHPEYVKNSWVTDFNFKKNGTYFIWAQGKLNDGVEFTSFTKAEVISGEPTNPNAPLGDNRKGTDQSTVVTLDNTKVRAGKMVMINYQVTRSDGKEATLTPYLGAMAHIIAVAPQGEELIHVHPMDSEKPNVGMIHATFPTAGDYRVWIQIVDREELKTIPLSITVLK